MGEKRYLTGEYLKYYEEFSSSNVNSSATNFKSEVEILTQEFANIKNVIVNWSGEGALALSNQALTSIFNKFDAIQQNVDSALIPATEAMENLKIELKLMKEKEELLIQKEEELAIENAKNIPEKVPNGKNKDGRTIYKINPEYSAWLKRKEDLALEIKNLITLLDETKLKCEEYIETIALLEGSMTEFSDYLGITKTVLGFDGGITSEYSSMSLEERVATLNSLLDNYKVVLAELDEMYNQAYGKGLSFSNKDFENVFMLFDAFDLFYKSGTDINEFKNLASDGSNVLMKIDALTKVMSYCRSTGAIQKITDYLNGESWEESGLAELYDQDGIFGYNENKFNLRMRTWYGLGNPKEYLKNNLSGILNSWENLDEAYTQYEAMRETVGVMKAKVDSFEKAIKLLPYEIHIEDELFIGKYKDKKYGNFSELSDIYNNNMTDTEKALYSYLKDTKGEAYAREYLDLMEDPMNMREGMARAKEYVEWLGKDGFQITDIALSGTEGFKDGVRTFFDGIADLFRVADTEAGTKSALDYELMYKAQYMLDMADSLDIDIDPNLRNFLNQAYQTGSTVGTMAVPMIAGAIPGAGQVLSTTLMTASFAGNAAVEGRQNGLGVGAAYLYGAISGGSEVILEKTLGRVPFVGNLSGSLVKDAASEMLEEGIQAYIDAGLGVVFYGEEFDFKATTAEAWESAKQAAISTPFMQGFGKVVGATVGTTSTIAVNTFTRGNYTTGQVYEMVSQKISDFYVGKADAAISAGIDVANVNGKVSMLDKLFLDKAISNVSAEELSGITSKMPKEGLEKLVDSGILSKKSMEKLNLADTFTKIESQPAGQKLDVSSLTSKDLKAEVTRDGQTLSEYIGSNKRDSVTPETISELKDISRSQAHKVETVIKEEIKAEIKQARHDAVMATAKKTVAGIKNFVTQSQATTTASTQQHATISQLGQSQGTQPVHSQQTVQSQTEIAPVVDTVQNGSVRQNFDVFAAQDTTLASQERHNNIPRMAKASSVGIISALGAIFPRLSAKFGGNTVIGKAQLDAKQVRLSEQQSTTAQTSITTTQSSIAAEQTSAPAKTETRQEYRDTITGEQAHEKSRKFHEETAQQRTKDNNAVATTENVEVTKSRDNQPVARAREDVIEEEFINDLDKNNLDLTKYDDDTLYRFRIAIANAFLSIDDYGDLTLLPDVIKHDIDVLNLVFENYNLDSFGKIDPIISKFLVDNFERVIEKIRNGEISSSYITDLPIEFQNSEKLIDACIDSGKLDGLASANNKEYIILQEDRILEQIEKGAMFSLKSLPEKLRASEKIIEAIMKKGTIDCLTGVTNAEFVLQKKDLLIDSINKYGFEMFEVPQFMLDDHDIVNAIAGCTSIYFPNLRGNDLKLLEQVIIERINSGKDVNVDLIKYLKNSSQIANAYFKNGIFDCASLFDSSILTPENIDLIVTEIERETKYPNLEKFPEYIKNSSEIVKLLIERNVIEGIFGATPEAISQNRNTIISLIENGTFFGEKIDYIAAAIKNDREIISLLVKNGDLRILNYADSQIVLENKEGILNGIKNGHEFSILSTMPEEIRTSKEIVEAILLTGNLKNIKDALDAAFDERNIQIFAETIKNTRQEIFLEECLGELTNYPLAIRNSPEIIYAMLEKVSFKQSGEIKVSEDSTLYTFKGITNEFIENNVNELVKHIQNWDTVVQFMSKIDVSDETKLILWEKIITRRYNSIYVYREIPAFVVTKLETEIIDSLRRQCTVDREFSLDYISPEIKKLPSFLELSLEKLSINDIFADPILSELISEQQVIEYIEKNNIDISLRSFPEKYKSSPEFLEYLAEKGYISFIFECNQDALTDKTIALIADTIRKKSPLKENSLYSRSYEMFSHIDPNSRIAKSSVILQALIDGKNFDTIINFNSEAYTTEIVEKILEEVLNGNFKNYSYLISKIDESKFNNDVVEKIVDSFLGGNLEILSILPDNLIVKYQERIIENFPYDEVMKRGEFYRLDDMKSFILASPDIVREFIDRGRYFEHDRYDFNRESLRANIDYFAEKILNGDINLDADATLIANNEFLSSPKVVEALIKTGNLEMMRRVNPEAITENNINLFIEQLRKGKDISLLVFYPEVIRNNKLVIETLTQTGKVSVLTGLPTEFYFDYSESISKSLGITEASYKEKIEKLLSINDEIFSTLNLAMLSDSLSGLNLEFIERCSLYGDIQQAIINLSNNPKYLQTFIKISNILQKNIQNIDLNGIVYRILNNGLSSNSSFATLLNEINVDSLTSEQMSTLIKILQTKNNLYEIQNMEDLIPENYIKKKQQYFDNMIAAVEKGTLSLEQMKSLVASKLFDLDYELVSFINDRYNFDINALERLDNTVEKEELAEVIEFLKAVNKVVTTTDIDVLRNIYLNANVILNNNLLDNFAIEETIRSKYAKLFSNTLYTPQENDLSQNNMLRTVRYKGKNIKVYQVRDAFRMQIHSLGAYREFKIPENFKTDWLRPKIAFHGICTSYIGNDSISPAFIGYPVLGFSEYEESALLLSGNYDLFSDSTIAKYETSMAKAYTFLPPSMMIDYTRHNHNEMVLERRKNTNTDGEISKRLPNYIVYFVEDMGESNFSEKNALWNETKQAAADFEVPIVVINRSHFLQSEMEQCKKLEEEFFETHSTEKLRTIMNKYINNSVGCRFLGNTLKKGTTAFSPKVTQKFYERVLDEVERLIANNQKTEASNIVDELLEIIEKENIAFEVSHKSERLEKTFDYIKERNRLESLKNRLMN